MSLKNPVWHDSIEKGSRTKAGRRATRRRTFGTVPKILGYSNAIVIGDALRRAIIDREEFAAQHGPVRVLWRNGKPVNPETA